VDGKAKRSCVTSVKSVVGKSIQTIEGMNDALAVRIKDAWKSQAVSQCGYCQTGQIMASYELIANREEKTPVNFREQLSNLCRCGTYNRIHHALETVVSELDAEEAP
jgi:isoquinoline 1-oxidoreductase alpha subunit